jgi:hypothetical protein
MRIFSSGHDRREVGEGAVEIGVSVISRRTGLWSEDNSLRLDASIVWWGSFVRAMSRTSGR